MWIARNVRLLVLACLAGLGCAGPSNSAATASDTGKLPSAGTARSLAAEMRSATRLAYGPQGVLFVGDSKGSAVYALSLPPEPEHGDTVSFFNVYDVERRIAVSLGEPVDGISIGDLAVAPGGHTAYLAVTRGFGSAARPSVVMVTRSGEVRVLDLASTPAQRAPLRDPLPEQPGTGIGRMPAADLTITDMDFADGALYVAGLTRGAFRSTLRRVAYPFAPERSGHSSADTYVEMYHTVHDRLETRAPINQMAIVSLDGTPTVVAAYTCTPLVTIPVSALANGARVRGKTVAEIGYASTPTEVLAYTERGMDGRAHPVVLVTTKQRSAALFTLEGITRANGGSGLTAPSAFDPAGLAHRTLPLAGVLAAADQNEDLILTLRRNVETGGLDLVSWRKGLYVRASDFVPSMGLERYDGTDPIQKQLQDNVDRMARDEQIPVKAPPRVDGVYPSGDSVPENLLRVQLRFSAPMRPGFAASHVRLLDERRRVVDGAFFEPEDELWDGENRELTLLLHPARLKSGLAASERLGAPLRAGHRYTLMIAAGWPSADGAALSDSIVKRWTVVEAQRDRLDERRWRAASPTAGTVALLTIDFGAAMSRPWLERHLRISSASGSPVRGIIRVDRGERRWHFTPTAPWARGRYVVEADARLEDLAGNNFQEPFERRAEGPTRDVVSVQVPFVVR